MWEYFVLVDEAVKDFGRAVGLHGFKLDQTDKAEILFDDNSKFEFKRLESILFLSFFFPLPKSGKLRVYENLLSLTHLDNDHNYNLQVGLIKDSFVVFSVRLQETELVESCCLSVFDFLWELKQVYMSV